MEARCGCGVVEEWWHGALEARSGPGDVNCLEARCRVVDVEVWKSGIAVQALRYGGMEVLVRVVGVDVKV